jgi:hypothetical protein
MSKTLPAWTDGSAEMELYGLFICSLYFTKDSTFQTGILVHELLHLYGARNFAPDEKRAEEVAIQDWISRALRLALEKQDDPIFVAYNFGFFVMDH